MDQCHDFDPIMSASSGNARHSMDQFCFCTADTFKVDLKIYLLKKKEKKLCWPGVKYVVSKMVLLKILFLKETICLRGVAINYLADELLGSNLFPKYVSSNYHIFVLLESFVIFIFEIEMMNSLYVTHTFLFLNIKVVDSKKKKGSLCMT